MNKDTDQFYSNAEEYWAAIPATIDGMLGGYGFVSHTDIRDSNTFLCRLFKGKNPPGKEYALDCGAGIGRISKNLLLNVFERIDLVEQNATFLNTAKDYIGPKLLPKVDNFFESGLQSFVPEEGKYDLIWIQWVLGHLTDTDFVDFFQRCQLGLKPNGVIVVKENITSSGQTERDEKDSSVTRPLSVLKTLFVKAGLDCYLQLKQLNFPKGLYTVYMFALRPNNK